MLTGRCLCGAAFATNASARSSRLRFPSGTESIQADDPRTHRIRLGTLDGDPDRRPLMHVTVASKAPWFEITDGLPWLAEDAPVPPVEWDDESAPGDGSAD